MTKRKKWLIILLTALVLLVVVVGFVFMDGKSFETGRCVVTQNGACVWIDEDGSPIVLHDRSSGQDLFDGLTSGDTIRFVRDDAIMESYPMQVNVYFCWKTGDGSLEDIPADALAALTRTGWIPAE